MATYNWLVRCGCGSPTEYSCSTCGEKLCKHCKDKHLKINRYHSITEYAKKLMPGIVSSPPCHDHDDKECIYWCQPCSKAACIDCVTTLHRGHEFIKLETVLQKKRESMQNELENLESGDLKDWQDLMIEARTITSDFLDRVNGIEKELEGRAKEFYKRVEEILEKYRKQLNEIRTSHLTILHKQEKEVSDGLEKVKQEIKECEDRLRSSDIESLLEHEGTKASKKDLLPKLSCVIPPVFSPSQIDAKALEEMFGQLTALSTDRPTDGDSRFNIDTSHNTQMPSTTDEAKKSAETTQSAGPSRPFEESPKEIKRSSHYSTARIRPPSCMIPKPSLQAEFHTETSFPSVACVGSGQAWVETESKKIQLVTETGLVKDTIHTDFSFNDVVLSHEGVILLVDTDNRCIKSISADKTLKILCKLKWEPSGLCCLYSGEIAVTFCDEGRVVIYSMSGKVIKNLDKKLFSNPYSVAQSKVYSDIYISDAGKVVTLDKDYKVRNEYTGPGNGESFSPCGVCTDNVGNVLITDNENNKVHILDKDGRFLQYLLTAEQGLYRPWSIDVDVYGNAWVGEGGRVKVVKYLQ